MNTFEDLFQQVKNIYRSEYIAPGTPIAISAISHKSALSSERTLQSIVHKAVVTSLTGSSDTKRQQNDTKSPAQIRVSIANDTATIAINTS